MRNKLFLSFPAPDRKNFKRRAWSVLLTTAVDNIKFTDLILDPFSEQDICACFPTIEDFLSMMMEPVDSAFIALFQHQCEKDVFACTLSVFDYIIRHISENSDNLLHQYIHLLTVNSCLSKYHMILNRPKRIISLFLAEEIDSPFIREKSQHFKISVCSLIVNCLFWELENSIKKPQYTMSYRDKLVDELDIIMRGCL